MHSKFKARLEKRQNIFGWYFGCDVMDRCKQKATSRSKDSDLFGGNAVNFLRCPKAQVLIFQAATE